MPSKSSCTRRPRIGGGTVKLVRYHQGTAEGLSESIARREKLRPIAYVIPGSARRFIPKNGFGYTPSSTSVPTTVDGTVARYQPVGWNVRDEIFAPSVPTRADDWIIQPARRGWRCWARAPAAETNKRRKAGVNRFTRLVVTARVCTTSSETRSLRGCAESRRATRPCARRRVRSRNARTCRTSAGRDTTSTPLRAVLRR